MARVRLKPLARQTIVITGATSGIGLATARLAGRPGEVGCPGARVPPKQPRTAGP